MITHKLLSLHNIGCYVTSAIFLFHPMVLLCVVNFDSLVTTGTADNVGLCYIFTYFQQFVSRRLFICHFIICTIYFVYNFNMGIFNEMSVHYTTRSNNVTAINQQTFLGDQERSLLNTKTEICPMGYRRSLHSCATL